MEEREIDFQNTWDVWLNADDPIIKKEAQDHMFVLVKNACDACCKKKAVGIRLPDLEEKSLNATIKVMNKIINDNIRPEKISSYVYLWCIGELYNKKTKMWERSLSYEDVFDNYAYEYDNNQLNICRTHYGNGELIQYEQKDY